MDLQTLTPDQARRNSRMGHHGPKDGRWCRRCAKKWAQTKGYCAACYRESGQKERDKAEAHTLAVQDVIAEYDAKVAAPPPARPRRTVTLLVPGVGEKYKCGGRKPAPVEFEVVFDGT